MSSVVRTTWLACVCCAQMLAAQQFDTSTIMLEKAKLTAAGPTSTVMAEHSLALDGNTALVGAPTYFGDCIAGQASDPGSVRVYSRTGSNWALQATITSPDPFPDYYTFGCSVALSGETALIGSPLSNAAYVYVRTGNTWVQQAAIADCPFGFSCEYFGREVALSGDTALISSGAFQGHDGRVRVFVRSGSSWTFQDELIMPGAPWTRIPRSVALSGDTAVVGENGAGPSCGGPAVGSGRAFVFVRNGVTWSLQAELMAPGSHASDLFGMSVSVSGNTVLVGAPQTPTPAGAAYVFSRIGTTWTLEAELIPSYPTDDFGFGMSVACDGDKAVVGTIDKYGANFGGEIAYAFIRSGTSWTQRARLLHSEWLSDPNVSFRPVAVSGNSALVGAPTLGFQGSVFVYDIRDDVGQFVDWENGTIPYLPPPYIHGSGSLAGGGQFQLACFQTPWFTPFDVSLFIVGLDPLFSPFKGGVLGPTPYLLFFLPEGLIGKGAFPVNVAMPPGLPSGFDLWVQYWGTDYGLSYGWISSNTVQLVAP